MGWGENKEKAATLGNCVFFLLLAQGFSWNASIIIYMKITKLHLKDFQQFKDLTLDFTHPETGKPLERVCLIGRNGTGKTTILEQLNDVLTHILTKRRFYVGEIDIDNFQYKNNTKIDINFSFDNKTIELNNFSGSLGFWFYKKFQDTGLLVRNSKTADSNTFHYEPLPNYLNNNLKDFVEKNLKMLNKIHDVLNTLSYVKGESTTFNESYPSSTVNEALKLFEYFPEVNEISTNTINNFWQKLIYHIKKRENDRATFENAEENLNKTKRELIDEFEKNEPNILEELAQLWNSILEKGNLYFDYKNANNPIQLNDNLTAYIKAKTTGETIPYNKLSTGIKNFIFQLGHLKAIHFNRKIDNCFLLVDEPSQGLFPDFVYDLVEMYESVVTPNTQIFMATHNPIVAAQFEPYERFILDFDEEGFVKVQRGVSPIGDDPNDILHDDFLIENLMPKQGLEAWQRYKDLKREIRFLRQKQPKNGEQEKLDKLIQEMSDLGSKYHF